MEDNILYIIQGTIIDRYGEAIKGVTITIKYQDNQANTTSDGSGQFIFDSNSTPFIKGVNNSLITLTFNKEAYQPLTIDLPEPTILPIETIPSIEGPTRVEALDEITYTYKVGDKEFSSKLQSVAQSKANNYWNNLRVNQNKQITDLSGGDEIQLEDEENTTQTPQTTISGVVLDENGSPLKDAKVNITSQPKQPNPEDTLEGITPAPTTSPINETLTTKEDGTWEFKIPTTNVNPKELSINFSKDEKELKVITNPQLTSYIPETKESTIEIPRVTLLIPPDISYTESKKVEQEIKTEENKELKKQVNSELPPEDKLANSINLKKEEIKKLLIPFIISLLIPFGAAALQAIIAKLPIEKIKDLVKCPSAAFIKNLIVKRNKLVTQINNIYNTVKLLTAILAGTTIVISAIQVGINLIALVPIPPGIPGGVVIASSKLAKALEKAQITVSVLTLTLASFGVVLGAIINLLNSLDILLQKCAQDNDMDFEELNSEINALANPTVEIAQSENNIYKNFTLTVKIDQTNESKYIKRYAVATNKQGVDVLKTDSSFASDPAVLISQLKFIIDSNPSITAE
jgi:hypothetical protein